MNKVVVNALVLIPIGLLTASCATTPTIGSVAGGECKLPGLHTPTYAVRGKTSYDQGWTDDVTEALVRGCNQPRPKARPASLDEVVKTTPVVAASPAPVPVKLHWWQKIKLKK